MSVNSRNIINILIGTLAVIATLTQAQAATSEVNMPKTISSGYASEFVDIMNNLQLEKDTSYTLGGNVVADQCSVLMNKDMVVGDLGKAVAKAFQDNAQQLPMLVQGGTMTRYCKAYDDLSIKDKSLVWVFVLTSMAYFESSCKPKAKAKGPNGTAFGFYQLHKGKEQLYDDKMGFCKKNVGGDPQKASICALAMLEKQFTVDDGELFSSESYWDVLRLNGVSKGAKLIRRALHKTSLCDPKGT